MTPDLLTAAQEVRPIRSGTRKASGFPALPPQAWSLGVVLPIAFSSVAAAVWTALAFFSGHGRPTIRVIVLLAFASAGSFALPALAAGRLAGCATRRATLRQQLARCSFASVVLVFFLPEYLARLVPPLLRSGLLLTIAALLWIALCALCIRACQGSIEPAPRRHTSRLSGHLPGFVALLVLFGIVSALAIRKYLVFGYVGQDLAYFAQVMHTTLHGHLFWGNLLQDLIYSKPVATDFAGHNSIIMFLVLPFYALAPSPVTLLVLRNLVLVACAVPVFLLARRRVSAPTAWLWVAAFLLTPAILEQTVFDFYPLTFVALPLLFTLYFYIEQRYAAFCVAGFLTLLVREDLVFFIFGMGLLPLLQPFTGRVAGSPVARSLLRWTAIPLAFAAAWAALSFLVIMPTALHGSTFVTDACFAHLGASPRQMLESVLLHPRENVLVHGNIVYLKTLLTPSGMLLSSGSLLSALCLPYLAINMLAGAGRCITTVISAQYSVIPASLLFAGALLAATRPAAPRSWGRRLATLGRLGLHNDAVAPLLLIALCCASLVFVIDKPEIDSFRPQPWGSEARRVLSLIPAQASVAAPRYMLPHLANRDCLYQTHRLLQYHQPVYEYLILDSEWAHINASEDYRAQYSLVERQAASNPALRLIYKSSQYKVYRDVALRSATCSSPVFRATTDHQISRLHSAATPTLP